MRKNIKGALRRSNMHRNYRLTRKNCIKVQSDARDHKTNTIGIFQIERDIVTH